MITIIRKVISLLNSKQKTSLSILFVFMFIGMLLETLGIGLIIPLFSVITDQNFFEKFPSIGIFLSKIFPKNWSVNLSDLNIDQNELIISAVIIGINLYDI